MIDHLSNVVRVLTNVIVFTVYGVVVWVGLSLCVCTHRYDWSPSRSVPSRSELAGRITDYIHSETARRKIVGMMAAVVDSEGVLVADGFGWADKAMKLEADTSTLFPIASVTKTFTGIAVMQLVEQGRVDLDRPIGDYIEELALPNGEEAVITTRMLLTHHSGLHGDILYHWCLPAVTSDPHVAEQIIELINENGSIFKPGKLHSYCNTGYALLGILISRVSGMSYPEYIQSKILKPLGIRKSIVYAGESTDRVIASGYDGKKVVSMPMMLGISAGGMALTANDAASYIQAVCEAYHGSGALLKPETMKQMMTPQNQDIPLDRGFSMGLAWFLQDPLGLDTPWASHRGELPPYHAMVMILPELKCGVMISVNTNQAADAPDEMARQILSWLYQYQTGRSPSPYTPAPESPYQRDRVKKFEGIYPNAYFGPMKLEAKKHKLVLKSPTMPMPLELVTRTDGSFTLKVKLLGLIPIPVKQLESIRVELREIMGEQYLYFIIQNSILNPNLKIEPFDIPSDYQQYRGKYRVINMQNSDRIVKDVKLEFNGDFCVLNYTFLGRHKFMLAVQPMDGKHAKLAGVGYFVGDKISWDTSQGRIRMNWSGLILEKE